MTQHILIIDDESSVRDAFCLALETKGYVVTTATDGLVGVEMAKSHRPDLVFLDLKMPGIDGVETLKRLKAHDPTINVYIVTAFAREFLTQLAQARSEGYVFEVATKPLNSHQIRQIVAAVLGTSVDNDVKFVLTLYISSHESATDILINNLREALRESLPAESWLLNVVDVLTMPEKAIANDIFTTPTLVRELPEPIVKLLGNVATLPTMMAVVTRLNHYTATLVV
jgi:CheY-like chemotaxis protein